MPLSIAQLSRVRDIIGDDDPDSANDYMLSDAVLNAIYDDADQGSEDVERTVVYALERLVGKTARKFAQTGQYQTEQQQQWHEHLKDLLGYWRKRTGVGQAFGTLSVGTLRLNTDYSDDDLRAGL